MTSVTVHCSGKLGLNPLQPGISEIPYKTQLRIVSPKGDEAKNLHTYSRFSLTVMFRSVNAPIFLAFSEVEGHPPLRHLGRVVVTDFGCH